MKIKKIKKTVINEIGCFVARWILHNCDDGLVISRKGGARQIIKVFSEPAYRNVIKPAIYKATEVIKVGDVVTDDGYWREMVVTRIDANTFRGYSRKDGIVAAGLALKDFKKVVGHVDVNIENT